MIRRSPRPAPRGELPAHGLVGAVAARELLVGAGIPVIGTVRCRSAETAVAVILLARQNDAQSTFGKQGEILLAESLQ